MKEIQIILIDFNSEIENEFNKSFQLPLMELDIEKLHIPSIEYQADGYFNNCSY